MGKILGAISAVTEVCWHENKITLSIRVEKLLCCKFVIINTLLMLFYKVEQSYEIAVFEDYAQIYFKIIWCPVCACRENAAIFVAITARGGLRETQRAAPCLRDLRTYHLVKVQY
jgi:hypothetical protein